MTERGRGDGMETEELKVPYQLRKQQRRYLPVKRAVDLLLSTGGIVVLSPVLLGICAAIKLDSPGPVLFKQKRVGKNQELFEIYKFRTMRTDSPKDQPTHLLSDPEQYITRVGKVLRRTSLDELPQLFNIWKGEMHVVSSRPALWNQKDLIEAREGYGVHQIAPGLTGWAQINGRDELEIPVKARLDGEYIEKLGLWMDVKCFLGTIGAVLNREGVVEGGTGVMEVQKKEPDGVMSPEKRQKNILIGGAVLMGMAGAGVAALAVVRRMKGRGEIPGRVREAGVRGDGVSGYWRRKQAVGSALLALGGCGVCGIGGVYGRRKRKGFPEEGDVQEADVGREGVRDEWFSWKEGKELREKRILITGADSYIGMAVERWLKEANERGGRTLYQVDTLDVKGERWKEQDFSCYDVVFHVAGIAHQKETADNAHLYYEVNEHLAVKVAEKAWKEGVRQFILLSSMSVYGMESGTITKETEPAPKTHYGRSKYNADKRISKLADDTFKVAVLRPPMVYGKHCKGNYQLLRKFALHTPVFPAIKNQRSMVYIDHLAEFVQRVMDEDASGLFFPQDAEYVNISDMVKQIAHINGRNIRLVTCFSPFIKIGLKSNINVLKKVFGDLTYEPCDTIGAKNFNQIMKMIER